MPEGTDAAKPPLPPALRRFHGLVMRAVMADLSAVFHQHDLSPAQVSTLFHLREAGELSAGALGGRLGLTSGTITHLLGRLAARGLVERAAPGSDRRERRVRLSADGLALLSTVDVRLDAALAGLLKPAPAALLAELTSVLNRLTPLLADRDATEAG